MQSIIKYLSSPLTTEAQGMPSVSVVEPGNQHQAPLQSCLWSCNPLDHSRIPPLQVQAAFLQEPSAEGCRSSLPGLGMQTPHGACTHHQSIPWQLQFADWALLSQGFGRCGAGQVFHLLTRVSLLCNSCGRNSSGDQFWSLLFTAIHRSKYLFNWGVIVVLEWQCSGKKIRWLIRTERTLAF